MSKSSVWCSNCHDPKCELRLADCREKNGLGGVPAHRPPTTLIDDPACGCDHTRQCHAFGVGPCLVCSCSKYHRAFGSTHHPTSILPPPPDAELGVKYDSAKPPVELLPYDALLEVTKVLKHGAEKYAPRNWEKGIPVSRVFAACMRHAWAAFNGEDNDQESGLPHVAHLACEALFWAAFHIRKTPGIDDRPKGLSK